MAFGYVAECELQAANGVFPAVLAAIQSRQRTCFSGLRDLAPLPTEPPCEEIVDLLEEQGRCGVPASSRFDTLYFLLVGVDGDDLEGYRATEPTLSPCYGLRTPDAVEDVEIEGQIELVADDGPTVTLDVQTELLNEVVLAERCR